MSISIDWVTRIIYIPKNDLTLFQQSPVEIRELNINWFRLQLKSLEDSEQGMLYPDTHNHYAEVSLGGLNFARVVEIINNYTISFEDGQYAVNLVGANSNIGDRVNVNLVSVRSNNSAAMISNSAIEYASFNGGVTVDVTSSYYGTVYPVGTPQQPVNNLRDAMLIAKYRGFPNLYIIGDIVIDEALDFREMIFIGSSKTKTHIHIDGIALVDRCEFYEAYVTGVLDGESTLKSCMISDLLYITGYIEDCVLTSGVFIIGGGSQANFLNCYTSIVNTDMEIPIIDMGGFGQSLAIRNFNGSFILRNKVGPEIITIDMNSGQIYMDMDTITNGVFSIRGIGKCMNLQTNQHVKTGTYGDLYVYNELISRDNIAEAVWDEPLVNHIIPGSTGQTLSISKFEDKIHIDSLLGSSITQFPYGTHTYPVNSLDNALIVNSIYNYNSLCITGDLIITQDLTTFSLFSARTFLIDRINLNGKTFTTTTFNNLYLFGSMVGINTLFTSCYINNVSNISGEMINCRIAGLIKVESGNILSGINVVVEGDNTTIDLQNSPDTIVSLDVNSGIITFINCVTDCLIELNLRGGEIVLDSSCTGGEFYAEGYGTLYNESNMTIKDNHLLALETLDPLRKQIPGSYTTGTAGLIISNTNKIVNENQALLLS